MAYSYKITFCQGIDVSSMALWLKGWKTFKAHCQFIGTLAGLNGFKSHLWLSANTLNCSWKPNIQTVLMQGGNN